MKVCQSLPKLTTVLMVKNGLRSQIMVRTAFNNSLIMIKKGYFSRVAFEDK